MAKKLHSRDFSIQSTPAGFNIPKIKVKSTALLRYVSPSDRDASELVREVDRTCLDPELKIRKQWNVHVVHIVNPASAVEKRFREKRVEMKEQCGGRPVQEVLGFYVCRDRGLAGDIARHGIKNNPYHKACLGDPSHGVYLFRYLDVALLSHRDASSTCILVFKVLLGRTKPVPVSDSGVALAAVREPTPNYDAHVSQSNPKCDEPVSALCNKSQMYLYEYTDDAVPAEFPRQCLPFGVLEFRSSGVGRPVSGTHTTRPKSISASAASAGWTSVRRPANEPTRKASSDQFGQCLKEVSNFNCPTVQHISLSTSQVTVNDADAFSSFSGKEAHLSAAGVPLANSESSEWRTPLECRDNHNVLPSELAHSTDEPSLTQVGIVQHPHPMGFPCKDPRVQNQAGESESASVTPPVSVDQGLSLFAAAASRDPRLRRFTVSEHPVGQSRGDFSVFQESTGRSFSEKPSCSPAENVMATVRKFWGSADSKDECSVPLQQMESDPMDSWGLTWNGMDFQGNQNEYPVHDQRVKHNSQQPTHTTDYHPSGRDHRLSQERTFDRNLFESRHLETSSTVLDEKDLASRQETEERSKFNKISPVQFLSRTPVKSVLKKSTSSGPLPLHADAKKTRRLSYQDYLKKKKAETQIGTKAKDDDEQHLTTHFEGKETATPVQAGPSEKPVGQSTECPGSQPHAVGGDAEPPSSSTVLAGEKTSCIPANMSIETTSDDMQQNSTKDLLGCQSRSHVLTPQKQQLTNKLSLHRDQQLLSVSKDLNSTEHRPLPVDSEHGIADKVMANNTNSSKCDETVKNNMPVTEDDANVTLDPLSGSASAEMKTTDMLEKKQTEKDSAELNMSSLLEVAGHQVLFADIAEDMESENALSMFLDDANVCEKSSEVYEVEKDTGKETDNAVFETQTEDKSIEDSATEDEIHTNSVIDETVAIQLTNGRGGVTESKLSPKVVESKKQDRTAVLDLTPKSGPYQDDDENTAQLLRIAKGLRGKPAQSSAEDREGRTSSLNYDQSQRSRTVSPCSDSSTRTSGKSSGFSSKESTPDVSCSRLYLVSSRTSKRMEKVKKTNVSDKTNVETAKTGNRRKRKRTDKKDDAAVVANATDSVDSYALVRLAKGLRPGKSIQIDGLGKNPTDAPLPILEGTKRKKKNQAGEKKKCGQPKGRKNQQQDQDTDKKSKGKTGSSGGTTKKKSSSQVSPSSPTDDDIDYTDFQFEEPQDFCVSICDDMESGKKGSDPDASDDKTSPRDKVQACKLLPVVKVEPGETALPTDCGRALPLSYLGLKHWTEALLLPSLDPQLELVDLFKAANGHADFDNCAICQKVIDRETLKENDSFSSEPSEDACPTIVPPPAKSIPVQDGKEILSSENLCEKEDENLSTDRKLSPVLEPEVVASDEKFLAGSIVQEDGKDVDLPGIAAPPLADAEQENGPAVDRHVQGNSFSPPPLPLPDCVTVDTETGNIENPCSPSSSCGLPKTEMVIQMNTEISSSAPLCKRARAEMGIENNTEKLSSASLCKPATHDKIEKDPETLFSPPLPCDLGRGEMVTEHSAVSPSSLLSLHKPALGNGKSTENLFVLPLCESARIDERIQNRTETRLSPLLSSDFSRTEVIIESDTQDPTAPILHEPATADEETENKTEHHNNQSSCLSLLHHSTADVARKVDQGSSLSQTEVGKTDAAADQSKKGVLKHFQVPTANLEGSGNKGSVLFQSVDGKTEATVDAFKKGVQKHFQVAEEGSDVLNNTDSQNSELVDVTAILEGSGNRGSSFSQHVDGQNETVADPSKTIVQKHFQVPTANLQGKENKTLSLFQTVDGKTDTTVDPSKQFVQKHFQVAKEASDVSNNTDSRNSEKDSEPVSANMRLQFTSPRVRNVRPRPSFAVCSQGSTKQNWQRWKSNQALQMQGKTTTDTNCTIKSKTDVPGCGSGTDFGPSGHHIPGTGNKGYISGQTDFSQSDAPTFGSSNHNLLCPSKDRLESKLPSASNDGRNMSEHTTNLSFLKTCGSTVQSKPSIETGYWLGINELRRLHQPDNGVASRDQEACSYVTNISPSKLSSLMPSENAFASTQLACANKSSVPGTNNNTFTKDSTDIFEMVSRSRNAAIETQRSSIPGLDLVQQTKPCDSVTGIHGINSNALKIAELSQQTGLALSDSQESGGEVVQTDNNSKEDCLKPVQDKLHGANEELQQHTKTVILNRELLEESCSQDKDKDSDNKDLNENKTEELSRPVREIVYTGEDLDILGTPYEGSGVMESRKKHVPFVCKSLKRKVNNSRMEVTATDSCNKKVDHDREQSSKVEDKVTSSENNILKDLEEISKEVDMTGCPIPSFTRTRTNRQNEETSDRDNRKSRKHSFCSDPPSENQRKNCAENVQPHGAQSVLQISTGSVGQPPPPGITEQLPARPGSELQPKLMVGQPLCHQAMPAALDLHLKTRVPMTSAPGNSMTSTVPITVSLPIHNPNLIAAAKPDESFVNFSRQYLAFSQPFMQTLCSRPPPPLPSVRTPLSVQPLPPGTSGQMEVSKVAEPSPQIVSLTSHPSSVPNQEPAEGSCSLRNSTPSVVSGLARSISKPSERDAKSDDSQTKGEIDVISWFAEREAVARNPPKKDVIDWFSDIIDGKRSGPSVSSLEPELKKARLDFMDSLKHKRNRLWDVQERSKEASFTKNKRSDLCDSLDIPTKVYRKRSSSNESAEPVRLKVKKHKKSDSKRVSFKVGLSSHGKCKRHGPLKKVVNLDSNSDSDGSVNSDSEACSMSHSQTTDRSGDQATVTSDIAAETIREPKMDDKVSLENEKDLTNSNSVSACELSKDTVKSVHNSDCDHSNLSNRARTRWDKRENISAKSKMQHEDTDDEMNEYAHTLLEGDINVANLKMISNKISASILKSVSLSPSVSKSSDRSLKKSSSTLQNQSMDQKGMKPEGPQTKASDRLTDKPLEFLEFAKEMIMQRLEEEDIGRNSPTQPDQHENVSSCGETSADSSCASQQKLSDEGQSEVRDPTLDAKEKQDKSNTATAGDQLTSTKDRSTSETYKMDTASLSAITEAEINKLKSIVCRLLPTSSSTTAQTNTVVQSLPGLSTAAVAQDGSVGNLPRNDSSVSPQLRNMQGEDNCSKRNSAGRDWSLFLTTSRPSYRRLPSASVEGRNYYGDVINVPATVDKMKTVPRGSSNPPAASSHCSGLLSTTTQKPAVTSSSLPRSYCETDSKSAVSKLTTYTSSKSDKVKLSAVATCALPMQSANHSTTSVFKGTLTPSITKTAVSVTVKPSYTAIPAGATSGILGEQNLFEFASSVVTQAQKTLDSCADTSYKQKPIVQASATEQISTSVLQTCSGEQLTTFTQKNPTSSSYAQESTQLCSIPQEQAKSKTLKVWLNENFPGEDPHSFIPFLSHDMTADVSDMSNKTKKNILFRVRKYLEQANPSMMPSGSPAPVIVPPTPKVLLLEDFAADQIELELRLVEGCLRLLEATQAIKTMPDQSNQTDPSGQFPAGQSLDGESQITIKDALTLVVQDFSNAMKDVSRDWRGRPHQRLPSELLLCDEQDQLYTKEHVFVMLIKAIPSRPFGKLLQLKKDLEDSMSKLGHAACNNKTQVLNQEKQRIQLLRKQRSQIMRTFTGTVNANRLKKLKITQINYSTCQFHLLRVLGHESVAKMVFFRASNEAIQNHLQTVTKEMT